MSWCWCLRVLGADCWNDLQVVVISIPGELVSCDWLDWGTGCSVSGIGILACFHISEIKRIKQNNKYI